MGEINMQWCDKEFEEIKIVNHPVADYDEDSRNDGHPIINITDYDDV